MTVALSSLRVSAEMDASAYTRGMAEKVAADQAGAASSAAVAASIRQVDTAFATTGGVLGQLSKAYIDGYGTAAKFEKGIRDLGRALETGNATSTQAGAIYSAMAQKLRLTADAGQLAAKGQLGLASVVAQANTAIAKQNELLERSEAAPKNAAAAADLQKTFGFTSQADRSAQSMRQLFGVVREGDPAFVALKGTVEGSTKAHEAHGHAVVGNYIAMEESQHVIQSFTDVILAGGSPLQAFRDEMSRISEIAGGPGGINNLFQAGANYFGGYLKVITSLANPVTLVAGALVGLGTAGLYAFNAWDERLNALQISLNGLGRSTGLTLGGLNQLAVSSAGGRTSSSQAAEAITAFTATGKISPAMMGQLTAPQAGQSQGLVQQFSQATGEGYSDSLKKLAVDFADPTKGAEELNKQFGLLGDSQLQLVRHLDASGDRFGAQSRLLDDLRDHIKTAADVTSIWGKAWEGVATSAANAVGYIGHFVTGPTPEEALAAVRARIAASGGPGATYAPDIEYGNLRTGRASANTADLARERTLGDIVANNALAASWQGEQQRAGEKSRDIGDIARRTNPDIDRQQKLIDDLAKLQEAMNTPGALGKTDPKAAQEAVDRLNAEVKNFGTTAQIVALDSASATAATMAQTATQRTAIEATKAWNDVVRAGGGYALAAATSTAKWAAAIAESQKAADDQTRKVDEAHGLIGLHGLDRQIQEINQHYDELKRNSVPGGLSSLDRGMTALAGPSSPYGGLDHGQYFPPSLTLNPGANGPWAQHAGVPAAPSATGWPAGAIGGGAPTVDTSGYLQPKQSSAEKLALAQRKEVIDATTVAVDNLSDSQQKSIDASQRMLDLQIATWGKTPGQIAEATEKVKLYNDEISSSGKRLADAMAAQNDAFAKQAGAQADQQERYKNFTDTMSGARSNFRDLAGTVGSDLLAHKDVGRDLNTALTQKAMSFGLDQLTNAAFGQPGQGGGGGLIGGPLGSILGPMFGVGGKGGTTSAQVFNAGTLIVGSVSGIGGALSGLTGGGGAAGGGIGGLFSSLFSGGSGGVGTFSNGFGAPPVFSAAGGPISGPGGPRSDSIPAMLSNGEYVINANSTSRYRPLLDHINYRGYADGGPVTPMRPTFVASPSVQSDNAPIAVHITNNHPTGQVESVKQSRDPASGRRLDLTFSDAAAGALHSPAGRRAMAGYGVKPPLIPRG